MPEKYHANMVISMVDIEYMLPKTVNGLPKSVIVKVPTAVPCKRIKVGDELVLHIPASQKGTANGYDAASHTGASPEEAEDSGLRAFALSGCPCGCR